jgi:hypothetical protein
MTDSVFTTLSVRQDTASSVADLLTIDSVAGLDGNGAAVRFVNNSAVEGLEFILGRLSVRRVDAGTVQMDLAVAHDPTLSAGDDTPALLSLSSGASGAILRTAAGSALGVGGMLNVDGNTTLGGALTVTGATTLNGGLTINGNASVTGTIDGRDISTDGAKLDQHLGDTSNPHNTTAGQVGVPVSLAGVRNPGGDIALAVSGALTVTPDDANNRITIGETHSARTDNPHATTAVQVGALPIAGGTVSGNLGIGVNPGLRLDVADRARVRQGPNGSAGLWFFQTGPNNDRAFVGMQDDNTVGFWGNTGAAWGLTMNITTADVRVVGSVTAGAFVGIGAAVRGMIVMWSGAPTQVPAGWALCNGQNGTPDLRSRFIVGAGPGGDPAYNVNDAGGPDQHTHSINVPAVNVNTGGSGQHSHAPPAAWYDRSLLGDVAAAGKNFYNAIDRGGPGVRSVRTSDDGFHSHSVGIDPPPFDSAPDGGQNRPKWYALCFIMRL